MDNENLIEKRALLEAKLSQSIDVMETIRNTWEIKSKPEECASPELLKHYEKNYEKAARIAQNRKDELTRFLKRNSKLFKGVNFENVDIPTSLKGDE